MYEHTATQFLTGFSLNNGRDDRAQKMLFLKNMEDGGTCANAMYRTLDYP